MNDVPPLAREAIALARAGDFEAALAKANAALRVHEDDGGLQLFAGLLYSRLLQLPEAILHFRRAVELSPNDPAARLELIRALIGNEELDEGEALLGRGGLPPREADKLRSALLARRGRFGEAAALLRALTEQDPSDIESWNHLGAALLSHGEAGDAAAAFAKSLKLRSEQPAIWDKWVDAVMASGGGESALAELGQAIGQAAVPAARLLDRLDRPDEAIATLERNAAANPDALTGLSALADMLERRNRIEELEEVIGRIERSSPSFDRLPLLKAKLELRRKQFANARQWAEQCPPLVDPGTRWQVIGEASDRLGEHEQAWASYAAMNAEDARANASGRAEAEQYLDKLANETAVLDEEWAREWRPNEPATPQPFVLIGFPRSGTTLLDTFLTAHPELYVSEEYPLLPTMSHAAGPVAGLPAMEDERIEELRTLYWATARHYLPDRGSKQLVDKYPFGLVAAPYIHRLFPGAPILFVERHPCDVVLSCTFTRFQPVGPAAALGDLEMTARLYDGMMRFWAKSRDLLPLNVLDVRYERMVEDTEGEMRAVAGFLGLDWAEGLTENRTAATNRGHIRTPSYAQVSEPVYSRSVERWRNYAKQMEPALPILEPWVKKLGYSL